MKKLILTGISCVIAGTIFSQVLFTYGANEVTAEEFMSAFSRTNSSTANKEQAIKEYLDLYTKFKLKVKAAKELQMDTLPQLKYDLINFRHRLENDYPFEVKDVIVSTNFKRNLSLKDAELFRFADSVSLIPGDKRYAIERKVIFNIADMAVYAFEWLKFVRDYKLDYTRYKGENNQQLLDSFFVKKISSFYKEHLETYDADFKYQLQAFKEGNMLYEVMTQKVWSKPLSDIEVLKQFFEADKERFSWKESADVIVVNAKYYAYAAYASESIKAGLDWRKIAATSEGMIQADSGRYELAQLPLKAGAAFTGGAVMEIVKNETGNGASFCKMIKHYPAKQQRTFEEAKEMVINEYQQQLEKNWLDELQKKYPVKVNDIVFKTLVEKIK